jgi:cytochrome c oxidase cbb3-type subunit 3
MDPLNLPDDDIHAIVAFVHSVAATMQGQGGPPRGNPVPPMSAVLVGNAAAGQAYFAAHCGSCHSVTGDLQGFGTRFADATSGEVDVRAMQTAWVGGTGGGGGRGGRGGGRGGGAGATPVTVTVTMANGQKIEGRRIRMDDFLVIVGLDDGTERSIARNGDVPKVEVHDPMDAHHQLLTVLTDKDMHDVTAYLASIK